MDLVHEKEVHTVQEVHMVQCCVCKTLVCLFVSKATMSARLSSFSHPYTRVW